MKSAEITRITDVAGLDTFSGSSESRSAYWVDRLQFWLDRWTILAHRNLPSTALEARCAFRRTLLEDTEYAENQVDSFIERIGGITESSSFLPWLEITMREFSERVRPWLPLWTGYVLWLLEWCSAQGYTQVVFLARDAFPLYVIASQVAGKLKIGLSLRLLHASRATINNPAFDHHFNHCIRSREPLALVDTGCYGSILAGLVRRCRACRISPGALYFYSRNPNVFGYMNYLVAAEMLEGGLSRASRRRLADFVIYAGDVLEGMPKLYRVNGLSPDGDPQVTVHDIVSFVLASQMLEQLTLYSDVLTIPDAKRAMVSLCSLYDRARSDRSCRDRLLFDQFAPKSPPATSYLQAEELLHLPPQGELFGLDLG
jgi:hypothetical protein